MNNTRIQLNPIRSQRSHFQEKSCLQEKYVFDNDALPKFKRMLDDVTNNLKGSLRTNLFNKFSENLHSPRAPDVVKNLQDAKVLSQREVFGEGKPCLNDDVILELLKFIDYKDKLAFLSTCKNSRLFLRFFFQLALTPSELVLANNEKIQFAQKAKLMIKVKVKVAEELKKEFWELFRFISNPNNEQAIFDCIEGIEFCGEEQYGIMQLLLLTIAEKAVQFKNLKSFKCEKISKNLIFPKNLNTLTSFKCGNIDFGVKVTLPSLDNLTSFECGDINKGTTLNLPESLNSLNSFKCGELISNLNFPKLKNLTSLEFLSIGFRGNLTFSDELKNLRSFKCGTFYPNFPLTFPEVLDNLTSFVCEEIYGKADVIIPKSKSLTSFKCGVIHDTATLTFQKEYSNLTSIEFGTIGSAVTITFPKELKSIKSFSCKMLCSDITLVLTDAFKNLETLTIEYGADNNCLLELPELNCLTTSNIHEDIKIEVRK